MTGLTLSYVHGASDQPLLGETIGQFFDAVCDKWASRPALVVRHQKVRLSYGELRQAGRQARRRAADARPSSRRPHRHLVAQQLGMGADPIRHRQSRSHPGQYQSRLSHRRTGIRAQQSRLQGAHPRRAFQDLGLCRHVARTGAGTRPRHAGQARIGAAAGAAFGRAARRRLASRHVPLLRNSRRAAPPRRTSASPNWRRNCNSTSRSTSSSPRAPPAFPKARRCRITTSSTTASSSARRCG